MNTTDTHSDEMLAIAKRFFGAVSAGDIDAVRAMYAPDAKIWHNNDGQTQTVDQNLVVLGWIAANVKNFRYEDVRCEATAMGFVEQHVTCGVGLKGNEFRIPACIVCTVVDGKVTRVDEYLDSAHVAAIAG